MPLGPAYDWVEAIVGLDDFMAAVRYGNALARQDGILKKLITPVAAPVPYDTFKRHRKFLRRDQSVVLLMIARHAMDAVGLRYGSVDAIRDKEGSFQVIELNSAPGVTGLASLGYHDHAVALYCRVLRAYFEN